jgi:hypothetical protein
LLKYRQSDRERGKERWAMEDEQHRLEMYKQTNQAAIDFFQSYVELRGNYP